MFRWVYAKLSRKQKMEPLSLEQKRGIVIEPDPETHNPTKKWDKLKVKQPWQSVTLVDPATGPVADDCVRFVCISDTHAKLFKVADRIPDGDVLLHAGDFTNIGWPGEVKEFNEILGIINIIKTLQHFLNSQLCKNFVIFCDYLHSGYRQHISIGGKTIILLWGNYKCTCMYFGRDASLHHYGIYF